MASMSMAGGRSIMVAAYIIGAFLMARARTYSYFRAIGSCIAGEAITEVRTSHVNSSSSCAIVVASSPEMARIFLRSQDLDQSFASRRPSIVGEIFVYKRLPVLICRLTTGTGVARGRSLS
ncbi:hypothetical protein R1flu_005568 [Riccia fluitans]|uniref:Secreted protein n=1 Tax=Riccia fluitans TaxID=41844 RepID=A0ABD1YWA7_9MARC